MIFLSGLKRICDISLYMTFASIVVYVFSGDHLISTLPIFVLVAFLSSYFILDGNLRYVSAIPLLLIYWIVPLTIVNFLMVTPAIAYLIWTFPKSDEDVERYRYQSIYEVFFIILTIALVVNFFVMESYSIDLPRDAFLFATSFLLNSIIFMRITRIDDRVVSQTRLKKTITTMVVCVMIGAFLFTLNAFSGLVDHIWPSTSEVSNTEDVVTDVPLRDQENISLQELDGIFVFDLESLSLQELDDLSLLDLENLSLQDLNELSLLDLGGISLQELDDLLLLLDLDDQIMKELSLLDLEDLSLQDLEDLFSLDVENQSRPDLDNRSQLDLNSRSVSDQASLSLLDWDVLSLLNLDNVSLQDLGELTILNLEDLALQDIRDQVLQTLVDLPLLDLRELPFPDLEDIPLLNLEDLPFLDFEDLSFLDLKNLPSLIRENLSFLDLDNLLQFDLDEVVDFVIIPSLVGGSAVVASSVMLLIIFVPFIIAALIVSLIISLIKFANKSESTVSKDEGFAGFEEERISLDKKKKEGIFKRKAENQVRSVYKRFLIAVKKKGLRLPPHLTSYDVQTLVAAQFESEKSGDLRDEYIRVRYGEANYTKEDVARIKALYKEVKSDIELS